MSSSTPGGTSTRLRWSPSLNAPSGASLPERQPTPVFPSSSSARRTVAAVCSIADVRALPMASAPPAAREPTLEIDSMHDKRTQWWWLMAAWAVALVSTLGALFIGEVMGMTPCVLCWYQRIAMFPLVIILAVGLMPFEERCVRYALPLAVVGWIVALYHSLLYWGVIPKDLVPCGEGASCTDVKAVLFGFVPVPLLSIAAFSLVVVILSIVKKGSRNE